MSDAWIDATNGAAGDMILGALLDAGADLAVVNGCVARLAIEPIRIEFTSVRRHGLRAGRAVVIAPETTVERGLADILALLAAAGLDGPVEQFAAAVFGRLAAAEARVHGVTESEVHFHEVGALDTITDVLGCAAALADLGLLAPGTRVVVSPVGVGSGSVRSAHGRLPVPVPAVIELLTRAQAPLAGGGSELEMCTPTGAAVLATLATEWGPAPALTLHASGAGAGAADPAGHPNLTRILIGRAAVEKDAAVETELVLVESTIDDLEPRLLPGLLDALCAAGALDAWSSPVGMRKGRPGVVVTALAAPAAVQPVFRAYVRNSPTLGVRTHPVGRIALRRDTVVVTLDGVPISVKRGWLDAELVTAQPEFDDVARAATALGLAERVVLTRVNADPQCQLGDPRP